MSALFSRFKMRGLELSNRIVVSPMGQYSGDEGSATDWHLMHLGHLAVSGAGLLITEATAVAETGRLSKTDLGLYSDANEEALARVVAFCRKHGGAKLGIQLYHGGRKGSITPAWEGQKTIPVDKGGWTPSSASDIPYPGRNIPEALNENGTQAAIDVMKDPAVAKQFYDQDLTVSVLGPAEYAALLKEDAKKWEKVVKAAGIQME